MGIETDFDTDLYHAWPSLGLSLWTPSADWRQTANLKYGRGNAYPRTRGFRIAAELLAVYINQSGVAADGLIFPFLLGWRHHIELALKSLIVDAELLVDIDQPAPSGHDLKRLWTRFRVAMSTGAAANDDELDNVERIIVELHEIDPVGEAFRYATTRDGRPTMGAVDQISFEAAGRALSAVGNYLDAAAMQLSVELDHRAECLSGR